jgi:peptide/nickel transport system substrate-binding protein
VNGNDRSCSIGATLGAGLILLLAGCGESARFRPTSHGGTLVIATAADPDVLFPPLVATTQARQITEVIYDYLAVVSPAMNTIGDAGFEPRLAESWKWSDDSLSIAFRIHPKAHWHDGIKADAADVRFTFALYTNPQLGSPTADDLRNIDSVTVKDSATAAFWFHTRSPHQFLDATEMLILPRHIFEKITGDSLREVGTRTEPIGTGRFRFRSWNRGSSVEVTADTTNYRGAPGLRRVIWSVVHDQAAAVTRLLGGEADFYAALRRENVDQLESHRELRLISLPSTEYVFMMFNLRNPKQHARAHEIFRSRELRRALTMAVDRDALVRNLFDTLASVAIGPTVRAFPTTAPDLPRIPYDPQRAVRILDSLGWKTSSPDGYRKRGGRELTFDLLVPSSSQTRVRMAVLLQEQLKRIGVRVTIEEMEFNSFADRLKAHDFDALLWSWNLGASATAVRDTWSGPAAREKGGLNYASYENPIFDANVDSATSTMNVAASKRYFTSAYTLIIDDAPAIWLYEPRTVIGVHRRVRTGRMRPDAWWFDLGSWQIPRSEEILRDKIR